jgi:ABC-type Fe3+-hydroxamate transport system substrate-binding protein
MLSLMTYIKCPRIISLVPSWTEMLLTLNIEVVGRTRFCIEPSDRIKQIPTVGGTKDWDLNHILSLKPDLLILDKDENPKSMSEGHTIPFVATHVHDIKSCAEGIQLIGQALATLLPEEKKKELDLLARRWETIASRPPLKSLTTNDWDHLPGLLEWVKKPNGPIEKIFYIIWKKPWMIATRSTFIGDVAHKVGLEISSSENNNKYPEIDLEKLASEKTLLLFSSEPFPFHKKKSDIEKMNFPSAIVDGQSFSWFGVRSLLFLENVLLTQSK